MIITPEQAALKARDQFDALREFVQQAAEAGQRIDTVERELFRQLLGLGHTLLSAFVAQQGDGDLGLQAETPDGRVVRRLPERHDRRYVSIFGELTIARVVYGSREGQRIERVPLDERLGLPEGDFSYVLEDWSQRLCLKESFAEAGRSLEMLLGLKLGGSDPGAHEPGGGRICPGVPGRPAGAPARGGGAAAGRHRRRQGCADASTAAGGGPRPHHRRTKGEKANKKQMACVGAVYTIEPFVRKCRRHPRRGAAGRAGRPTGPSRSTSTSGPR